MRQENQTLGVWSPQCNSIQAYFYVSSSLNLRFLEKPLLLVSFLRSSLLNIWKIRNFRRNFNFASFLEREAPGYISHMKHFTIWGFWGPQATQPTKPGHAVTYTSQEGALHSSRFSSPTHPDGIPFSGYRKLTLEGAQTSDLCHLPELFAFSLPYMQLCIQ